MSEERPLFMRTSQVRHYLGLGEKHLRRMISQGRLRPHYFNHHGWRYFLRTEVEQLGQREQSDGKRQQ